MHVGCAFCKQFCTFQEQFYGLSSLARRHTTALAMKGKAVSSTATRAGQSARNKDNTDDTPAPHIKKEEKAILNCTGPSKSSKKHTIRHEAKPGASMKPQKRQRVKREDTVAQQMVKLAPVSPTAYTGPFPKHMRPSPEECRVQCPCSPFHGSDLTVLSVWCLGSCLASPSCA